MTWVGGTTTFRALSGRGLTLFVVCCLLFSLVCCLLFVCCLMDLPLAQCPTRRKIEPDLNRRPDRHRDPSRLVVPHCGARLRVLRSQSKNAPENRQIRSVCGSRGVTPQVPAKTTRCCKAQTKLRSAIGSMLLCERLRKDDASP